MPYGSSRRNIVKIEMWLQMMLGQYIKTAQGATDSYTTDHAKGIAKYIFHTLENMLI